jgi:hypothetical protein
MTTFHVIDTKTGKEADIEQIARDEDEDWARDLVHTDMEGWAIGQGGDLMLLDECGNYANPPDPARFQVVFDEPYAPDLLAQVIASTPAPCGTLTDLHEPDPLLERGFPPEQIARVSVLKPGTQVWLIRQRHRHECCSECGHSRFMGYYPWEVTPPWTVSGTNTNGGRIHLYDAYDDTERRPDEVFASEAGAQAECDRRNAEGKG